MPILILVIIAIPSFRLLYYSDKAVDAAFTIKVTGHQWYWTYEYPDQGNFTVESRILPEADRVKQKPTRSAPAGGRRGDGDPQGHHGPHHRHRRRQLHARLDRAGLRHQEDGDPRPPQRGLDQRHARKASTSASARRSAATTTPTCRSRCAWSPRPNSTNGWSRRRRRPASRPRPTSLPPPLPPTAKRFAAGEIEMATAHGAAHDHHEPRARRPPHADRLASLRLQHEPQGHRHDVPGVRDHRRPDRRHLLGRACGSSCCSPACSTSTPPTARPTAICGTPSSRRTA